MDEQIQKALLNDRLVDMTTFGRRSGTPSRKEMVFHYIDGTLYLTGRPGKRDWYANVLARPDFTIHFKQSILADVPARATPIVGESEKRAVLDKILARLNYSDQFDAWVAGSPLVVVQLNPNGRV